MKGLIVKSTGSAFGVLLPLGEYIEAHVKGNFRLQGIRSTSPVAVGDQVEIDTLPDGTNWITAIHDRRNYLVRRSTNLSKQSHILAANVDQVVLIVTINYPQTATTFIDRVLATSEAYRIPAVLLFNKIDLLSPEETVELNYLRALYEHIGYPTYAISAKSLHGELDELFAGKTTLLSGNSGVGKSTLINALVGEEMTRTAAISDIHNQGKHTTTFSQMYFLDDSHQTAVIDTPGIRGFGTFDFEKEEVSHYFRDIFDLSKECRFSNCTHTNEPGCAVLPALEAGHLAPSRFESYLSLLGDCTEGKYR